MKSPRHMFSLYSLSTAQKDSLVRYFYFCHLPYANFARSQKKTTQNMKKPHITSPVNSPVCIISANQLHGRQYACATRVSHQQECRVDESRTWLVVDGRDARGILRRVAVVDRSQTAVRKNGLRRTARSATTTRRFVVTAIMIDLDGGLNRFGTSFDCSRRKQVRK